MRVMYAYVFERKKYPNAFEDVRREQAYGNKLFCRSYARSRTQTRDGITPVTVAFSCFFIVSIPGIFFFLHIRDFSRCA